MTRRVYRVASSRTGDEWLVRAHNAAQAIRHVVRGEFHAAVASQETLIEMLGAGARVLDTNDEPELELDEPGEVIGGDPAEPRDYIDESPRDAMEHVEAAP
jgi:hypothetical protein